MRPHPGRYTARMFEPRSYRFCKVCGSPVEYRVPSDDNRERATCTSTACGSIHYENPINVVKAGQLHLFYRARLLDTDFAPGPETIEAQLFSESEVPWDRIAFRTVRETLVRWFEDRRRGQFGLHCADIA